MKHHNSKASILQCSVFFVVQLSHLYITTRKTMALTIWTFVSKEMSLFFNMLSRFVTVFLPRSKCLNFEAEVTILSDLYTLLCTKDLPCSSVGKESVYSAGDPRSIPGLGRSPGEGNGNPFQYSCLENLMDCSLPARLLCPWNHKSQTRLSD
ncbi:unnamed protein product [Rangifer tarandus platyrhynchus]|uniref:Uncharacterized protein n=1 Tax=Rangifer tarandus platyrhynchus TaxID=3082113 RepID=A0AC59Z091_RANTA